MQEHGYSTKLYFKCYTLCYCIDRGLSVWRSYDFGILQNSKILKILVPPKMESEWLLLSGALFLSQSLLKNSFSRGHVKMETTLLRLLLLTQG